MIHSSRRLASLVSILLATAASAADIELIGRVPYPAGGTQPGLSAAGGPRTFTADGSAYVFATTSTAVAPGLLDLNGSYDIFVQSVGAAAPPTLLSHAAGLTKVTARGSSQEPKISGDGRWVLFDSTATNLISPPSSGEQVFLYDLQTKTTRLISHQAGAPTLAVSAKSIGHDLSDDGRFVSFSSLAPAGQLVPGATDTNAAYDLFLWDALTGSVQLVSRDPVDPLATIADPRVFAPIEVKNGGRVAFRGGRFLAEGATLNGYEIFLFDPTSGANILVSHSSSSPTEPAGGSFPTLCVSARSPGQVLFISTSTDLVSGVVDTNNEYDLFLYEMGSGDNELITVDPLNPNATGFSESTCGALSGDARWVHFNALSSTWNVYRRDRTKSETTLISVDANMPTEAAGGTTGPVHVSSADGSVVFFDSVATSLVTGNNLTGPGPWSFRQDMATGLVELAVHAPSSPTTSASAKTLASSPAASESLFSTPDPTGMTGAVHTAFDAPTQLLYEQEGASAPSLVTPAAFAGAGSGSITPYFYFYSPSSPEFPTALISEDGTKIAYVAASNEICGSGNPLCVVDRQSGEIHNAKHLWSDPGTFYSEDAFPLELSQDGRYLLLQSQSPDLAPVENNIDWDVFLYDTQAQTFELISHAAGQPTTTGNSGSRQLRNGVSGQMTADARWITFESRAGDLLPTPNTFSNAYLLDRQTQTLRLASHQVGDTQAGGNGSSFKPILAANGSAVVFESSAPNLFPGFVDNNGSGNRDLFLYDVATEEVHLVTRSDGNPVFGGNGIIHGTTRVSTDGRFVVHTNSGNILVAPDTDTNLADDIFRYDRATNTNTLISHIVGAPLETSNGTQTSLNGMSSDGRWVLFLSNGDGFVKGISGKQLYLWDGQDGSIRLVSHQLGNPGVPQGPGIGQAGLTADGRRVFFSTTATDVLPGLVDTNDRADFFVWERENGHIELLTPRWGNSSEAAGDCHFDLGSRISSSTGEFQLLWCEGPALTRFDNNEGKDLYLVQLQAPLFADGFESGSTDAWSLSIP